MKKILVVDDDTDLIEELASLFSRNDYKVERAENGRAGLEKAHEFKPDLIILDLMMPGMHGFEVCQAVRQDDKLKDVRILVVSGKRYQVDYRAADRLGANMFLSKPFDQGKMLEAVVTMIGKPGDPLPRVLDNPGPG